MNLNELKKYENEFTTHIIALLNFIPIFYKKYYMFLNASNSNIKK